MSGTNNGHRVKSTASSNPLSITDATGSYKPDGVYIWYTNSLSSGGDQENIDWSTDSTHYSFVDASLSLVESPMTLYTVTDLAETVPVDAGVQQAGGTDSDDQTAEQNTLVSLVAGSLTLTHSADSINFGSLKLDGNSHNLSASSGHFDVADATGSGNGWHVTVAATQFTDSSTGDTLPAGSLTLRQPTVSGVDGAETTGITINDPGTVDMTPGNEVPVASAATGTGMGKYEFAQDSSAGNDGATLNVPANAKAGSFDSMLTYKVTTGP
ncbi:MAG: WxL domain-containing protein [Sporolactobacillus sp.]